MSELSKMTEVVIIYNNGSTDSFCVNSDKTSELEFVKYALIGFDNIKEVRY